LGFYEKGRLRRVKAKANQGKGYLGERRRDKGGRRLSQTAVPQKNEEEFGKQRVPWEFPTEAYLTPQT